MFIEGQFLKTLHARSCKYHLSTKKNHFSNISLSANTVAERIAELSNDIYNQLCDKGKSFSAYFVGLDESTDINHNAQLAIFVRDVNNQFEVTEELLCVKTMKGRTTAKDVFEKLCDATEHAGLSWKSLQGITTDGAPSMSGRTNKVVALVHKTIGGGRCK